ncbi:MAG: spermidine synthase [Solirubrobacterales bacterium]
MKRSSSRDLPPLGLLVFVVGSASLGAEIAAARLMAPFFGASTIVWANTIGVVLLSLSIGYWLGGRFADRHPHKRGLCTLVLIAALAVGAIPFAADPFLDISVDALDDVSAGAFIGSLLGVTVLVAPPVILLGAVSPYAIRLAVERVEESGTVAGRMYAISTIGSLVGTWASALLLVPLVGTRRTFLIFGLACALVALPGITRRAALAVPAVIVALLALPVGTIKASGEGTVLEEVDTEYQYARVVEEPDGRRELELNEGQAVHSLYRPGSYLTGDIWDEYLVLPFAALARPPGNVAILGNAAGTTARALGRYFPQTEVDGVEIDGELTRLGRKWFDMRNPRLRVFHEDARPYLRRTDERYDVIMVDAYRQPYIPFYLTTREFFELVRDRLRPAGAVVVNAGHPEGQDDLEKVLAATMEEVFPVVLRDPSEDTNTLILGSRAASAARLRRAIPRLPPDLRALAQGTVVRLGPALEGGSVYTDDRAPVEWLIDKSIVEYAADGE